MYRHFPSSASGSGLGRTFVMPCIGMMASLMIGTVSGSAARLPLAIGAVQLADIT